VIRDYDKSAPKEKANLFAFDKNRTAEHIAKRCEPRPAVLSERVR